MSVGRYTTGDFKYVEGWLAQWNKRFDQKNVMDLQELLLMDDEEEKLRLQKLRFVWLRRLQDDLVDVIGMYSKDQPVRAVFVVLLSQVGGKIVTINNAIELTLDVLVSRNLDIFWYGAPFGRLLFGEHEPTDF